ncbi:MAG: hypothetical protein JXA99_03625 [Candidatus Lokiarchaeota archaeon]|nr:hypothetical protein [Candidatus Lokiarchaeota archaeon]
MKKKKTVLMFICIFASFTNFINLNNAEGYFYPYTLTTNKDHYFMDEFIEINASWFLTYEQETEICYFQIRIFDLQNTLIWNSSKYHEISSIENNYVIHHLNNISIKDFNLSFKNISTSIIITLFYHYLQYVPPIEITEYCLNKTIEIQKKELICELEGLRNEIFYSEQLDLQISFFDFENKTFLSNYNCRVEINKSNTFFFRKKYIVNNSIFTQSIISTIDNMSIGLNILNITILGFNIYQKKSFFFSFNVNRSPTKIKLIEYKNNIKPDDDFYLKIFHYYINNNSEIPIINQSITLQFKQSDYVLYEIINSTDINGIVQFKISNQELNFFNSINILNISILFGGNQFFSNNTLILSLNILKQSFPTELILFLSLSSIIFIPILIVLIKRLIIKNKTVQLGDITINY